VGIDIVDTARIARLLATSDRFSERWFTAEEVTQCRSEPSPPEAFAARLAAKEAVWKALGLGGWRGPVGWHDIATSGTREAVTVALTGQLGEAAARAGAGRVHVSFFAAADTSFAIALVEQGASQRL
jgi:phosphopantetheine--protein transferase-like protein